MSVSSYGAEPPHAILSRFEIDMDLAKDLIGLGLYLKTEWLKPRCLAYE